METLGGRYRLLEPLGEGGMALVYKAQDLLLERPVAVKVLREGWASDADFVARFRQEARAAARLSHPNIAAVYDVGEDAGRHYIVMEYLEGRSLKDELAGGPLSSLRLVEIGAQICAGLEYAHQKGIVHRDIKPHNILLCGGLAKIVDFGIARAVGMATHTQAGEVMGSPQYLSPEQVKGQEATAASDIYSLGVLLYEAATGALPFQSDSPLATALKHINEAPAPPRRLNQGLPPSLEAIILKAMAKEPGQRFAGASRMGQALAECLARSQEDTGALRAMPVAPAPLPLPVPVAGAPPLPRTVASRRRKVKRSFSWGPVMGAFALVALVAGLTLASPVLIRRYFATPAQGGTLVPTPSPVPSATRPPASTPTSVPMALVPNVTGTLPQDARILIEGQGLRYQEGGKESSNDVAEGRILRQAPPPGRTVATGNTVTVTISTGPATVRVPGVTDLAVALAEGQLKEAGLRTAIKEVWHATVPAGRVLQQEPMSGATVPTGSLVTLTVSKGRERMAVPNVVGMAEEKAQKAIQQAGLRNFLYVNYQGHDVLPRDTLVKVCVGCVLSTTPAGGEMVELGTEVRMAVRKD